MARARDYRAEYRRRIAAGHARGLTTPQARGHPRRGEPPAQLLTAIRKGDHVYVVPKPDPETGELHPVVTWMDPQGFWHSQQVSRAQWDKMRDWMDARGVDWTESP